VTWAKTARLVATALVLVAGCQASADTPEGTAERFLDAHYVRMSLADAKEYCVGVARSKVEEMQHLVGDQMIDDSTRKPHVSYELQETRDEGEDRVSFLFEGKIRVEGADEFTRHWLVNTRKEPDGAWRVSNFQEFE
jgi:hypothetical protein